ncbi:minor tail protein [Arthrobacter phage MaGuCo]|uniref:Minor tail protein n=1 Tax=Arthrobacter phage MaGuCo TaxID=3038363 RepID=A0AAF0GFA5_9CAUD|nr:minor tail protein [Arthrobacter phage MaGuCo]
MADAAAKLAARIADLERRLAAMERAPQLPSTTVDLADGETVIMSEALAAGVSAMAEAGVLDDKLTQARTDLDASTVRLDQAETDITDAFGRIDTVETTAGDAQTDAANALTEAEAARDAANTAEAQAADAQTAAADAVGIANGKGKVLIQSTAPAAADQNAVTLWIDTTGGANTPKKWTGSAWAAVTDKAATDAAAAAVAAQSAADAADAKADAAQAAADAADAKAEGADAKAVDAQTAASAAQTRADEAKARADDLWARGANLLENGGFESGILYSDSPATIPLATTDAIHLVDDTTKAHTGSRYLEMVLDGGNHTGYLANVPVSADRTYRIGVWVYAESALTAGGSFGLPFHWRNSSGSLINNTWPALYYWDAFGSQLTVGAWKYMVADITPPAGAVMMAPRFYISSTAGPAGAVVRFDDVTVVDATEALAAQAAADAAQSAATAAQTAAGNAQDTADSALTMAGSKGKVYYDTTTPSGTGTAAGDLWRRVDSSKNVIGEWYWTGSAWQTSQITTSAISNLDVGKLTAGSAAIPTLTSQKIAAATASFQTVDVRNLFATSGTLDTAVIDKLWTDVVNSRKITTRMLAVGDMSNLAAGSDFEYVTDMSTGEGQPWGIYGKWYLATDTSHSGTVSLKAGATGSVDSPELQVAIPTQAGDKFYAEFWVRRDSAYNGTSSNSKLRFGDQANGFLDAVSYGASDVPELNTWVKKNKVVTVPAGVTRLRVTIPANNTAGSVWLDDIIITRMVDSVVIADGAIDGKVITGATVRTAASGARIVLDSTGLNGWDASNVNYLKADSTGITVTGTLTARGDSSVSYLNTALGPRTASIRNGTTVTKRPGLSFYPDGESSLNPVRVRSALMSDDGVNIYLQGGEPVGFVPDGSSTVPASVTVGNASVDADAKNGGFTASGGSVGINARLSKATLSGTSLELTGRNSAGVKITSGGSVTFAKYGGGDVPLTGVSTINGTDIDVGAWQKLTLTGSWVDYVGGGGYRTGFWIRKHGDNLQIQGMVKSGSGTMTTLPTALWPAYSGMFPVIAVASPAGLYVSADTGQVSYLFGPSAPSYVQISLMIPLH